MKKLKNWLILIILIMRILRQVHVNLINVDMQSDMEIVYVYMKILGIKKVCKKCIDNHISNKEYVDMINKIEHHFNKSKGVKI